MTASQTTRRRFRPVRAARRAITWAVAAVALAGVCFFGGVFFSSHQANTPADLSAVVVQNRLEAIRQLATTRYAYTNMGQFEKSNDFYGVTIPFTTKRFIVSYDGVITAGVNLQNAKITLTGTALRVDLPAAAILTHEIDEASLEVFDETKNIFNPITIEDYNQFHLDQKDAMEQKAVDAGLLGEAAAQAKLAVESLLASTAEEAGLALQVHLAP